MMTTTSTQSIGWIGTGRMGYPMVMRLLQAGHKVRVYNRTRMKAEPLVEFGAEVVGTIAELAKCDIVFSMVSESADLLQVMTGEGGLLQQVATPRIIIDCSTVSAESSVEVRRAAVAKGANYLVAPVSGNGKVVKSGKLTIVASGSREIFDEVEPILLLMAKAAAYVGEDDLARLVKLAHNIFLGVVTQSMAEITVFAEKAGVPRSAFLAFLNDSVMGSVFTRYKSPAFVNLDMTPTFTPILLRKDFDLGLAAARNLEVPMPLASATHQIVQQAIGHGNSDMDFAVLLLEQARASSMDLKSEELVISDGLEVDSKGGNH